MQVHNMHETTREHKIKRVYKSFIERRNTGDRNGSLRISGCVDIVGYQVYISEVEGVQHMARKCHKCHK